MSMNRSTLFLIALLLVSVAGNVVMLLDREAADANPRPAASSPAIAIPVATPAPTAYPATVASPAPEPADVPLLRRRVAELEDQLKRTTEELLAVKEQRTRMEIPMNKDVDRKLKT